MPDTTASMAETHTRSIETAVAVTGMPASMAADRATLERFATDLRGRLVAQQEELRRLRIPGAP